MQSYHLILDILSSLAHITTATPDLEQMLTKSTEHISSELGYPRVQVYLLNEEDNELVLCAQSGSSPVSNRRQPMTLGIMGRAIQTRQIQRVADAPSDQDYFQVNPATRSELCVPIIAGGNVLGVINIESEQPAAFTIEDTAVLSTAAAILAGAMENARLYRRAQEAAVLEERNRLARELHDSVSQQLFSIMLTAQAARAHLDKNPQRTAAQLERLQETAIAALTEMRALIFQLRPPALTDQGLVTALQQHVATLSHREGLRIELSITGDERHARGIEQALYRIAQEALNNVVKHAHASTARVLLTFEVHRVQMIISDNGRGFDPSAPPTQQGAHLGLITMRERAAEIDGVLTLHSSLNSGTEITVTIHRA